MSEQFPRILTYLLIYVLYFTLYLVKATLIVKFQYTRIIENFFSLKINLFISRVAFYILKQKEKILDALLLGSLLLWHAYICLPTYTYLYTKSDSHSQKNCQLEWKKIHSSKLWCSLACKGITPLFTSIVIYPSFGVCLCLLLHGHKP